MGTLKLIVPASILAAGFIITSSSLYGIPEYSAKEKKSCTYCHEKVSSNKADMAANLKEMGKCYKEHDHSLTRCETK